MKHDEEAEQKIAFELLIQEYSEVLQMYMSKTRKNMGNRPSGPIAHELAEIDKRAKSQLHSDPSSSYGIETYEKARRRLRSKAFGKSKE